MLELDVHRVISETIRTVLWESLWREVRYAVIGVALAEVVEKARFEPAAAISTLLLQRVPTPSRPARAAGMNWRRLH